MQLDADIGQKNESNCSADGVLLNRYYFLSFFWALLINSSATLLGTGR